MKRNQKERPDLKMRFTATYLYCPGESTSNSEMDCSIRKHFKLNFKNANFRKCGTKVFFLGRGNWGGDRSSGHSIYSLEYKRALDIFPRPSIFRESWGGDRSRSRSLIWFIYVTYKHGLYSYVMYAPSTCKQTSQKHLIGFNYSSANA